MARQIGISCSDCRGKFGGDETFKRHRFIAGDRYKCYSTEELVARGMGRDRFGVWHRAADPNQGTLSLSVTPSGDEPPSGGGVGPTDARRLARATDPETSRINAEAIAPRTGTFKAVLLAAFRDEPGGLTRDEVAARTGLDPWQVSKRVSDLLSDGLIVKVGERPGRLGKPVMVCAAAEAVSA